jgi:autotransporter-associated beta strand protein
MWRESERMNRLFGLIAIVSTMALVAPRMTSADSFDWRNVNGYNWNSTVKSQFSGTCWDFGPTACLEAKYMITRNDPNFIPDLSEQQNCWENSPDMGSTAGGGGFDVIASYFATHGDVSETECPVDSDSTYWDTPSGGYPFLATGWESRVWKTTSYQINIATSSTPATNTAILKNAIKTTGPVFLDINPNELYHSVAELRASNYVYSSGGGHAVSLVGYCDDDTCPTGGYWIIKNSWGTGEGEYGYDYMPYASSVEANHCQNTLGAVYYTGPMYHTGSWDATGVDYTGTAATNTWKGTTNGTWDTSSGTSANWSNNATGLAFTWVNQEVQAVFDNTGANRAVTLSGVVIAHGLTFNSGATGYTFSGGSLTVTTAGITANESVSFTSPISVGAPQTWTIASGKTLTIGDLHTIISPLTISATGDMTITGSIDGGGVANIFGGAAAGTITKSGTGVLHFTGEGKNYAVPLSASGTISFEQTGGDDSNYTSTISGACSVTKSNSGTIVFSGANSYTGTTTVSAGALEANSGTGLPSSSFLSLAGGVIQSNGTATVTFSRTLASSGSSKFRFSSTAGGGFSAGDGPMTVKINNGTASVSWGTAATNIAGTLKFGSLTANNVVTLLNAINLNAATRTIDVTDNPNSTADWAVISGVISYGSGTAGLTKTGDGLLLLSGTNTYNGTTTISGGTLQADEGVGLPSGKLLVLDGGVLQFVSTTSFTRSLGTSGATFEWTANGGGFAAGNSALTVNIGGSGAALNWGTGVGSGIMGTLKFGSPTASYGVTFQNPINLNGGARTIEVDGNTATLTSLVSDSAGAGSLTKAGAGTLVLPIANTFSGNLTVTGGMLVGSVYNAFGPMSSSRAISVSGGGTLSLGASDMLGTYMSAIPSVSLNNGAVLNVSGTHQAFNTLTLNGGTLSAAGDAGTPGSGGWGSWNLSSLVTSYGTSLIGGTDSSASVTLLSGDVTSASTTFDVEDGSLTISLPIYNGIDGHTTDGGYLLHTTSLVKTGSGTLTLDAVNSYSGTTTINGGVISTNNLASAGVNCGIGCGSSLVFNGGGLVYSGTASLTFDRTITLGAGGGILGSSGGNLTYPLAITGAGAFTFQGGGSGTLTLSGSTANTYSGSTTVSGGTLVLAKTAGYYAIPGSFTIANTGTTVVVRNANQFPTTSVVTFSGTEYPTLELYGHSVTVAGFGGAGVIENTEAETGVGNGTLTVNNSADYTFSGYIRNSLSGSGVLSLIKNGAGALTLVGANTGSYSGGLTVNAGTLDYSGGALPTGNYTIAGGTLNTGAISKSIGYLHLTGGTVSGSGTLTSAYAYDVQAGAVSAVLAGTVGLTKTTSGSATVNSPTYTGNTIVRDGRLTFTGSLPTGNYLVSGGTLDIGGLSNSIHSFQITGGTVTGSGALNVTTYTFTVQGGQVDVALAGASNGVTKSSAQTAILSAANTYGGQTNVSAGNLQIRNLAALGTTAGKTVVASGAVLSVGGGLTGTINEPLNLNGTGDGNGALQAVDSGTNVTFAGAINLVSTSGIGGTAHIAVSSVVAGSSGLTKYGTNHVDLTGANTYTGATTVASGTLELAAAAQNVVFNLGGADVQGGKLVFDYNGASSPAATILNLLKADYDGGLWDVGQLKNTTAATTGLTLGWLDNGSSTVTVMATYAGDLNLDGIVNDQDLNTWMSYAGTGTTWQTGDVNYDGVVNGLDLDLLKASVGLPQLAAATAGVVGVPEPGTLALLAVSLLGLAAYAWRKRR